MDAEALPAAVVEGIKKEKVDLDSPATTLTLIKLNAVVGVKGSFNSDGSLKSVGLTCAVCHSTVDDSFAPGIGRRLDGRADVVRIEPSSQADVPATPRSTADSSRFAALPRCPDSIAYGGAWMRQGTQVEFISVSDASASLPVRAGDPVVAPGAAPQAQAR